MEDIKLRHLRIAREFIDALKVASIDQDGLDPAVLERLRNPPHAPLMLDDADIRFSIETYFATFRSAQRTYREVREGVLRRYPDSKMCSYEQVESLLAELTGIYPCMHDMCPKSCAAFTGPWATLEKCPECGEDRYDSVKSAEQNKPVPKQTFLSIPIALQIQAMLRSSLVSHAAGYRARYTEDLIAKLGDNDFAESYQDIFDADDYVSAVRRGEIKPDDVLLVSSEDGAQLYRHKESDVWFLIWIVFNYSADMRYKKKYILVDTIIPAGKVKPKHLDSFLYPSLHHVAAVQNMNNGAGLPVWNASQDRAYDAQLFVAMNTADSPGMAAVNGLVGHTGAKGCILFCNTCGRRKPGGTTYYPALLRPDNYDVVNCDHKNVNPATDIYLLNDEVYRSALKYVEESATQAEYEQRRKETGISKPSLFDGLRSGCSFGVPRMFPLDLMHLASLNIPDLLLSLWRGTINCAETDDKKNWPWMVLVGETWKRHGQLTEDARGFIPGCHDVAPRNIADKLNSGYKAKEHQTHLYGLCPGFLHGVLPDIYWEHFCKLVRVMQIIHQHSYTAQELAEAHRLALEFDVEFEVLYVRGRADRLHFVRPCVHKLIHLVPQAKSRGPLPLYSQWAMERTIGNLTEEIRQDSNPYTNLSWQAVRRAWCNTLQMLIPELDRDNRKAKLAKGSCALGEGYVLKPALDRTARPVAEDEKGPIAGFIAARGGLWRRQTVNRWARASLPNGDVARSRWAEDKISPSNLRMRQHVKVCVYLR
jgi:hypothetical protein